MHTLLGLLLASLAHGPALESSSHLHARAELAAHRAPFGLLVLVEETRLVAISRSHETFVLLFASPERGVSVARTLAPGATLDTRYPPFGLAGLTLEVLAAPEGRLTSSGRVGLDGGDLALGIELDSAAAGACRLLVTAERPLLRGRGSLPFPCSAAEPLHVPIPAPRDKPPGNRPPPIENEPLPPV